MAHTPGPWRVTSRVADGFRVEAVSNLYSIGEVWDCNGFPQNASNAALIAAAPDLFDALKGILEIGKRNMSNQKYDGYFDAARAAVAKAEGSK
jgi:hypothetical protein